MTSRVVIPGERLFKVDAEHISGSGTNVIHSHIYSSLAGYLACEPSEHDVNVKIVQVRRSLKKKHTVPFIGAVATCRVVQTTGRYAKCTILCVEDSILPHPFNGMIRKEDIKTLDKDSSDVFLCYHTGDVILARVISLGDVQSCLLSTAEETLGVVYGRCPKNHKMDPVNFKELACPTCNITETRKVAKIPHKLESKIFQAI